MDSLKLRPNPVFTGIQGQLVLLILDGVGLYRGQKDGYGGNAVDQAATPHLDRLIREAPVSMKLKAHGTAVGSAERRRHGKLRGRSQCDGGGSRLCPGRAVGQPGDC